MSEEQRSANPQENRSDAESLPADKPGGGLLACAPIIQGAKCPWRKGVDPRKIPGGYSVKKHRALRGTIAEPGDFRGTDRAMACHESNPGAERVCVGWLGHQLGPGNNLALRLKAIRGGVPPFRLVGEQHDHFEDTLPKRGGR